VDPGTEKKLDRLFYLLWSLFILAIYARPLLRGDLVPTSLFWYFEQQVQWIPYNNFFSNCIRHEGIIPAWCPHLYGGFYYLAYPFNYFYFLPDWIYIFLGRARGNCLVNLAGFMFGGLFFYRGLRRLELSPYAAFFGLLAFVGGSWFNLSVAYLPFPLFLYLFIFWAVAGIMTDRMRLRYFAAFWVCCSLCLTLDMEQLFYVCSAIFLTLLLAGKTRRWQRVALLLAGVGFAFLFESGPLLNLAAYLPHSVRGAGITFSNYISNYDRGGINLKAFLAGSVIPITGVVQPAYIGVLTLFLAGLGVKRLKIWGWLGLALIFLYALYIFNWTPLMKVLFRLPVVNRLAMHYAAAVVVFWATAFLAAKGVDEFISARSRLYYVLILVLVLLPLLGYIRLLFPEFFDVRVDWPQVLRILGTAALLIIALRYRHEKQWLLAAFVLLAVAFDVNYFSFRNQPWARTKDLADLPSVTEYLSKEKNLVRFWPLSVKLHEDTQVHPLVGMDLPLNLPGTHSMLGYWRVPTLRTARLIDLVAPGYLNLDEAERFQGIRIDIPRDYKQIDGDDLFWLRLFNVGNIISRGAELNVKGIEPNGSAGDIHFYRVIDTLPRYFLVSQIERFKDPEQVFKKIKDQDFDPETVALVEQDIAFIPHSGNSGQVHLKKFLPGDWQFDLSLPLARQNASPRVAQYFMVVSETYMPGWRAFARGYELKVFRADYGFMGLALPPGAYPVRLVFFPYPVRIAIWSTTAGIFFWLVLAGVWAAKSARRNQPSPSPL